MRRLAVLEADGRRGSRPNLFGALGVYKVDPFYNVDRRGAMRSKAYLGEFEQMVLLVVVGQRNDAASVDISRALEEGAGRSVSRGALYTTLDRLKRKGLLEWRVEPGRNACLS